ncbi:hypothetical protein FS749_004609 [Ceratobasidium sp. UAMH 11750]|nr:hypothetical protein FS749_004609 [Ceratobasidium sp. UAMH 11750]
MLLCSGFFIGLQFKFLRYPILDSGNYSRLFVGGCLKGWHLADLMVYGMKRDLFDRLECSHHTQTYFPGLLFNLSKPPDVRKTNGSESVCVAIIEAGYVV